MFSNFCEKVRVDFTKMLFTYLLDSFWRWSYILHMLKYHVQETRIWDANSLPQTNTEHLTFLTFSLRRAFGREKKKNLSSIMLPITFSPCKNPLNGVFRNNFLMVSNILEIPRNIYFFYQTSWWLSKQI